MSSNDHPGDVFIDANDCLVERIVVDGIDVLVRYTDIPESDITCVKGLRCTTPLRTVIDLAVEVDENQLALMVGDCLERGLFTLNDAWARLSEPDMRNYPGAVALRDFLSETSGRP